MSKFSKSEPRHKHKQDPQNAARHKFYLKVLYNVYVVLLMDNLVDNSNVAMLIMETIKEIITLHNMYSLTSYSISYKNIWLDSRNPCKPNIAYVTTVLI